MNKEFKAELKRELAVKDIEQIMQFVSLVRDLHNDNLQYVRLTVIPKISTAMMSLVSSKTSVISRDDCERFIEILNGLTTLLDGGNIDGDKVVIGCNQLDSVLRQMIFDR